MPEGSIFTYKNGKKQYLKGSDKTSYLSWVDSPVGVSGATWNFGVEGFFARDADVEVYITIDGTRRYLNRSGNKGVKCNPNLVGLVGENWTTRKYADGILQPLGVAIGDAFFLTENDEPQNYLCNESVDGSVVSMKKVGGEPLNNESVTFYLEASPSASKYKVIDVDSQSGQICSSKISSPLTNFELERASYFDVVKFENDVYIYIYSQSSINDGLPSVRIAARRREIPIARFDVSYDIISQDDEKLDERNAKTISIKKLPRCFVLNYGEIYFLMTPFESYSFKDIAQMVCKFRQFLQGFNTYP